MTHLFGTIMSQNLRWSKKRNLFSSIEPKQHLFNQQKSNKNLLYSTTAAVRLFGHVQLFAAPWTVACQVPLSMGFPRHKYWNGLTFPSPEDLPDPGIQPTSLVKVDSLPLSQPILILTVKKQREMRSFELEDFNLSYFFSEFQFWPHPSSNRLF